MTRPSYPAFKEWQVIVEALGRGAQIVILRKGGLAEGKGGFQANASRFWLFPTFFHEQRTKIKPGALAAAAFPATPPTGLVHLRFFVDLIEHFFLADWSVIQRLDPFHLWTEATIRERYAWARPPGIFVLLVRVHRLDEPLTIAVTRAMAGCRSWIDLAHDPSIDRSQPVLTDSAFAEQQEKLRAVLGR